VVASLSRVPEPMSHAKSGNSLAVTPPGRYAARQVQAARRHGLGGDGIAHSMGRELALTRSTPAVAPFQARRPRAGGLAFSVLLLLGPAVADAWIYPEHRDIATEAIARLSPSDRATLEALWSEARLGLPAKLCERLAAGDQGLRPECIDFAAFPALSGDHACSPRELLETVLPGGWVLKVAQVSAQTGAELAEAGSRQARLRAVATNNLKLQFVDPEYATRAGANNAHFLLPRAGDELGPYVDSCVAQGAPLNALGLYAQYHIAALGLAQQLASAALPPDQRAAVARQVLVLEGYSLHWLEDLYSAGHDVGTWGSSAWRKGTHDYYDEFGIDTVDWGGRSVEAFGDAYLTPADLERASTAVAESLRQVANALRPGDELGRLVQPSATGAAGILSFDACTETGQPAPAWPRGEVAPFFDGQLRRMPKPAKGPGTVHLPRFRDELGPFLGVYGALGGGASWGTAAGSSGTGSVAAGVRLGFGADSLTGSIGTGILFLEAGFEAETAQKNKCGDAPGCATVGTAALFPRVPARTGFTFGLRLPFWVIPGDMLLLGPVLALASPATLSKVAVEAASGGLIPYERSFSTGAGIFQVVAGREVRVGMFGYMNDLLGVVPTGTLPDGSSQYAVVQFKSVQLGFPILEWTPFRTFATQLMFAGQVQLGFSVSLPVSTEVLYPAGTPFSAGTGWSAWIRGVFDGRYFFGSREDLQSPR
jgi:hypothetical protein